MSPDLRRWPGPKRNTRTSPSYSAHDRVDRKAARARRPRRRALIACHRSRSLRIPIAAAAMASTSPTGRRNPVSPSRTTSGNPPAAVPMTGTPQASASSALNPNDSLSDGSRKRSAPASSGATVSIFPRKNTLSCSAEIARLPFGVGAIGAVADHHEHGRDLRARGRTRARRRARASRDGSSRCASGRAAPISHLVGTGCRAPVVDVGIDEVRDHLDAAGRAAEGRQRLLLQIARHGGERNRISRSRTS